MPEIERKLVNQVNQTEFTIKKALLDRGWKQQDLVDLLGIHKSIISRAIHGDMAPNCKRAREKIYKVLNIK